VTDRLELAALRSRRNRTQAQIADSIGTSQSGVSRLERQHDVLVSTLRDYVAATGGRLHLVARYSDFECEVHVPALEDLAEHLARPRVFRVVWQNQRTRQLVQVGSLEFTGQEHLFSYSAEARLHPDFEPFPAFPDFDRTYKSAELFSFFAGRVPAAAKNTHDSVRSALGLSRVEATPIELLARTWGATPHDTLQVVPMPVREGNREITSFLVSGIRHANESNPRVDGHVTHLSKGHRLEIRDEPDNPNNPRAILIEDSGLALGWVPDYMVDEIHKLRDAKSPVAVLVEQANGPDTPWHLRLLCRLEVDAG
jgi:transcriptional regulator with XRE-family HTH domain